MLLGEYTDVVMFIEIIYMIKKIPELVVKSPEYRGFGYLARMIRKEVPIVKWNIKPEDLCLGTPVKEVSITLGI